MANFFVLDSFHMLAMQGDLDRLLAIPGERIVFVQIADAPKLAMDVPSMSDAGRDTCGNPSRPLLSLAGLTF